MTSQKGEILSIRQNVKKKLQTNKSGFCVIEIFIYKRGSACRRNERLKPLDPSGPLKK